MFFLQLVNINIYIHCVSVFCILFMNQPLGAKGKHLLCFCLFCLVVVVVFCFCFVLFCVFCFLIQISDFIDIFFYSYLATH